MKIIPDKIDNCKVCFPIKTLLKILIEKGFKIIEKRCNDYHFHEVAFIVEGEIDKLLIDELKSIDEIEIHENGMLYCKCHWSTVEVKPR